MPAVLPVRAQDEEPDEEEVTDAGPAVTRKAMDIELGAPFRDNAVLQRGLKVPVWGWSKAGAEVTVEFGGQKKTAIAGSDGKWMAKLDELKASFEPAEMVIAEKSGKSVVLKNILVGEVWMASGQSNMQLPCSATDCNTLYPKAQAEFEAKGLKVAPIRQFAVTSVFAMLHPIEKADGEWKNGDYASYSAIAFAFAYKLYGELNVPIGILNCSFSETAIEAWVPREGFATGADEYTKSIHGKCLKTDPNTPEHKEAWGAFYKSLEDQLAANEVRFRKGEKALEVKAEVPGNMRGNRDASWMFNGKLNPVVPYAIRGAIWNQGFANMHAGLTYYDNLHSLIRGWRLKWDEPDLPVYFHQFYCQKMGEGSGSKPGMEPTAEMRLGTWLARDIPNAGMASQIDVGGAVHYVNKAVSGKRLALLALKNQYSKDIVAEGPMFKSYEVKGDKVTVEFDFADGGLVVADTTYNRTSKDTGATGLADPKVIENGESRVKLFWLADEDRVWHPATCRIDGDKVVVSSDGVKKPRGISYGSGGIGFQPCLYNKAMLPMTPFIYFDQKLVLSKSWQEEKLKIAGETIDPNTVGLRREWRKMPILAVQFCHNAILQADQPVTVWGSTQLYGERGTPAVGTGVIHFEFTPEQGSPQDVIKKTMPVTAGMDEWSVTLPPMKADGKSYRLKASFTLNGELAHERVSTNIVFGDVWYVGAPAVLGTPPAKKKKGPAGVAEPVGKPAGPIVRMIESRSKRSGFWKPSRFSVCVSRSPDSKYASLWMPAEGLAATIGKSIAAKTGRPVGIIYMESRKSGEEKADRSTLAHWIAPAFLNEAPSLMDDYKTVGSQYPGNPYYQENIRRYIADWKTYWGDYIPEMMQTRAVPDGKAWGSIPSPKPQIGDSGATQVYNIYVHPFAPTALAGVIFLTGEGMFKKGEGVNFGPEMAALVKTFKTSFGGDVPVLYTVPARNLMPKLTKPATIEGTSTAVEVSDWKDVRGVIEALGKL